MKKIVILILLGLLSIGFVLGKNDQQVIEYKKINPTKYRLILHKVSGSFPLVFGESFHDGWTLYLKKYEKHGVNISDLNNYKILEGNEKTQATLDELKYYIENGSITTLGDISQKIIYHKKLINGKEFIDHKENYFIDFVSKNYMGTIQNNNLQDGKYFETWFDNHIIGLEHSYMSGYANAWVIDVNKVCSQDNKCIKNDDGTYDMELVVEFWPQRLFYIGLYISGITLIIIMLYLAYSYLKPISSKVDN